MVILYVKIFASGFWVERRLFKQRWCPNVYYFNMVNDWGKPMEIFLIFFFLCWEHGGGNKTSTPKNKTVCCKCTQTSFYCESLYVRSIWLGVSMFRHALCHLGKRELQRFDPGSPLVVHPPFAVGSAVFREARYQTPLEPHDLLWACGSQGRGVLGWGSSWIGVFWGSALHPMGCRLGLGVLGSGAEQQAGFCPVSGPCRSP